MFLKQILALIIAILFSIFANPSWAVEVKFFRQYNARGELIRYEKNGQFSHVAISFNGGWFHAHPYGGVRVLKSTDFLGMDYVILENKNHPEPSLEFVTSQLKKTFDIFATWSDPGKTYCSKLIAEFFNISPRKMTFQSQNWSRINTPKGQKGISPDEIFFELQRHYGFEQKVDFMRQALNQAFPESRSPQCRFFLR